MKAELLDVDAPAWRVFLDDTDHDFYHLPGYVSLCAKQEGGVPRGLMVTSAGRDMLLPLIIRSIPGDGLDATSPYGYPGPLVRGTNDDAFLETAVAAGVEVLQAAGVVSAFVRLHPLLNPVPPSGIGTVVQHGDTVSVDLALPTDDLWEQIRLDHRRGIRRAMRLGCVARMDESWTHFDAFKRLYRATMERRSADRFYFFDDAYFAALRDALPDQLHLCLVEADGEIAAAGLFAETDRIVQYHLSGTSDAARNLQPTKLMMQFVLEWAKARGDRVLHLGGGVGAGNNSLMRFKNGFSPRRHAFSTLRIVIDEPGYRRLVEAVDPSLDPDDRSGYFPAYRRP